MGEPIPKTNSKAEKRKARTELNALKARIKRLVHIKDDYTCQNPWHKEWIGHFERIGKSLPRPTNNLEATHLIRRSQGGEWNIHDVTSMCGCCGYWTDNGLDHPLHGRITGRQFKIHVLRHKQRNDKNFRHEEQLEQLLREESGSLKPLEDE